MVISLWALDYVIVYNRSLQTTQKLLFDPAPSVIVYWLWLYFAKFSCLIVEILISKFKITYNRAISLSTAYQNVGTFSPKKSSLSGCWISNNFVCIISTQIVFLYWGFKLNTFSGEKFTFKFTTFDKSIKGEGTCDLLWNCFYYKNLNNCFVGFELCRRQNDPLICPLCRAKWKTNTFEVKR